MIKTREYNSLDLDTKTSIEAIADQEFGHIPIVRDTQWASPDWSIIMYEGKKIASFYNIILREILIDGKLTKAAGINNVITPKEHRGKGFSSAMLNSTREFLFDQLNCKVGLLLCADALIPFYRKLQWYTVDCPVFFAQKDGRHQWTANTMLLSPGKRIQPKEIDLDGLPW